MADMAPPKSPSPSVEKNAEKDWKPKPKEGADILNDRHTKTPFNPDSLKK